MSKPEPWTLSYTLIHYSTLYIAELGLYYIIIYNILLLLTYTFKRITEKELQKINQKNIFLIILP